MDQIKHCRAYVGWEPGPHGFVRVECGQVVGLRTFVDEFGEDIAYCSIPGHVLDLKRRFGTMAEAEAMYEARQAEIQELIDAEEADSRATCTAAKCTLPIGHGTLPDGAAHELRAGSLPDIPLADWSESEKAGAWGR